MSTRQEALELQQDLVQAQKFQFMAMMDLNSEFKKVSGTFESLSNEVKAIVSVFDVLRNGFVNLSGQLKMIGDALTVAFDLNPAGRDKMESNYQDLQQILGDNITELFDNLSIVPDQPLNAKSNQLTSTPFDDLKSKMAEWTKGFTGIGGDIKSGFSLIGTGVKDIIQGKSTATLGKAEVGGGLKMIGGGAKNAMMPLVQGFSKLFPQAAALALVMEPMTAFIGGLLEPFSMITDMFGAFGEILGTAFLPMLQTSIMPLLQAFLPIFVSLAQVLAPVIQLLFSFSGIGILIQILTPLMPIINTLAGLFAQVMTAIAPLLTLFSTIIGLGIDLLLTLLGNLFSGLGISLTDITNGITNFANAIQGFVDKITGWIDNLKAQAPEDWAISKSKEEGGWW